MADEERLIVLLEARVNDLEKGMKKAQGVANAAYREMKKGSQSATRQMEADMQRSTSRINQMLASTSTKIGSYGKAFVGGLVGGVVAGGIAGVVAKIAEVSRSIADVGDQARRAGVSARAFQEWKFVAEQNRIGIDQMTDGLKELNLRADEFVQTGKGSAAEAFMRLGYSAEDLKKKLQNPSALLLEIIDRLGKFDKAAQIRISDELFGGSAGERFVELLAQGEKGIRKTIDQAHELGAVMDDEVIERAAELDRKFNQITTTVGTGLKTAIVEAAGALQDFINTFRGWWQDYEKRLGAAKLGELAGSLAGTVAGPEPINRTTEKTDRLPKAVWTPPTPPPGGFGGSASDNAAKERERAAKAAEREAEKVRDLIDALQTELELVGRSDASKRVTETLRRAGAAVTEEQAIEIEKLIYQIEAETDALQKQKEAQEARNEALTNMFEMAGDGLLSVIDGSVKAEDAVKKLAVQLALAAAQAALLGTGPLAGLFGGLLGGGLQMFPGGMGFATPGIGLYADGTANTGGRRGEPQGIVHGQEAVIPLPSGGRVPVMVEGGGQQHVKVDVGVTVDDAGKLQAYVKDVTSTTMKAGIQAYDRGRYSRTISDIQDGRRRNAI